MSTYLTRPMVYWYRDEFFAPGFEELVRDDGGRPLTENQKGEVLRNAHKAVIRDCERFEYSHAVIAARPHSSGFEADDWHWTVHYYGSDNYLRATVHVKASPRGVRDPAVVRDPSAHKGFWYGRTLAEKNAPHGWPLEQKFTKCYIRKDGSGFWRLY